MKQSLENNEAFLLFRLQRNATMSKRPNGKFLLAIEKRFISKCSAIFKRQLNYVLEKAKEISTFRQSNYLKNSLEDEINRLVNNIPGKDDLVAEIVTVAKSAMERGGNYRVTEMKLGEYGISFSLQNKKAIDYLNAKKNLELSNYRGNITDVTKERIAEILTDAAKSGQSYQETAKLIMAQGDAGVFSPARSQTIATTEIGNAYEVGNRIPMDDFQEQNPDREVQKAWQTDGETNDECAENEDEGWINIDDDFPSGDQNPLAHPNCECTTLYQIN